MQSQFNKISLKYWLFLMVQKIITSKEGNNAYGEYNFYLYLRSALKVFMSLFILGSYF